MSSWAADTALAIPANRFKMEEITALWGTASSRLAAAQTGLCLQHDTAASAIAQQDARAQEGINARAHQDVRGAQVRLGLRVRVEGCLRLTQGAASAAVARRAVRSRLQVHSCN